MERGAEGTKVFVRMRRFGAQEECVLAEVLAVRGEEMDLITEDGAKLAGWRGDALDEAGAPVEKETIARMAAQESIAAMRERIVQMENRLTEV